MRYTIRPYNGGKWWNEGGVRVCLVEVDGE